MLLLGDVVIAHGGGAPEAATIVIPLLIVIGFVVRERKNVARLREQEQQGEDGSRPDQEAP